MVTEKGQTISYLLSLNGVILRREPRADITVLVQPVKSAICHRHPPPPVIAPDEFSLRGRFPGAQYWRVHTLTERSCSVHGSVAIDHNYESVADPSPCKDN